MRKRILAVTLPMLLCLLFVGCSGIQTTSEDGEASSVINEKSGTLADESELTNRVLVTK